MARSAIILFIGVTTAATAMACGSQDPTSATDTAVAAPGPVGPDVIATAAPPSEAATGPTLTPEERTKVVAILKDMRHRPSCNKIMGCDGAVALANYGQKTTPLFVEVLADNPKEDGYWLFRLLDLLGQSGDPRAGDLLETLLADGRWEVRVRAAWNLGRLKKRKHLPALRETLAAATAAKDDALAAAAHYALAAMSRGDEARAHREAISAFLPKEPAALGKMSMVILDILVSLAGEARIRSALPAVRECILHMNRFIRASAIQTAAAMQDNGAIPYLLTRLDDPLPSIRRKTVSALQAITGVSSLTRADHWRQWAARNSLDQIPKTPKATKPLPQ